MKQAIIGLSKSRKALAAAAGILVTLTLLATGQIDAETATASISGLLGVLMAGIAFEDGQAKRSDNPPEDRDE